ncbi:MAG: (Fe-S)-binding protein [Desulfobacterales bacterium]|jgi:heterodisulfide reductase subunit D
MSNPNFTIKQLLEMSACTNCRVCADICPAVSASGDGELSAIYRMKGLNEILKSRTGLLRKLLRKKGPTSEAHKQFGNTVFRCTLCGNCQEVCPVGIHLKDLWLSLRHDLVDSRHYPKKIDMVRDNLDESQNVFAEDNEERSDWVEDIRDAPDHGYIKDQADVVYFTGCVAAYYPLAQKIPVALAEILTVGGIDFTLLGEEEWCCGFPMLGAGLKDMVQEFIDHNVAAIRAKGATTVVFACPSCYQMWREYYPPEFDIFHGTQYLLNLVKEGRIPLRELDLTVTYHDPCDLGRGARVFDQPRELIQSIPGVKLVELSENREACRCCGGGGNLEMIDAELSKEIARQKIEAVIQTGAQAVVTACQQCVRTMTTYVRRNKVPLEVLDITQLIQRSLRAKV